MAQFESLARTLSEAIEKKETNPRKPREFYLAKYSYKDEWLVYDAATEGPRPGDAIKVREVFE